MSGRFSYISVKVYLSPEKSAKAPITLPAAINLDGISSLDSFWFSGTSL